MFGRNTRAKETVDRTPDQWPADIGEQMAAVHRIYPIVNTAADPRLVELLKPLRICALDSESRTLSATPRVKRPRHDEPGVGCGWPTSISKEKALQKCFSFYDKPLPFHDRAIAFGPNRPTYNCASVGYPTF